jgi:hypothetical protein
MSMKLGRRAAKLAVLGMAVAPACAAHAQDQRWQTTFNTEIRYFSSSSSNASPATSTVSGGKSSQVVVPFALQLSGRPNDDWKLDYSLRSSYVNARQTTATGGVGTFSGVTDTTFSTNATYYGINGVQPFISLSVNIPTGTSNAQGSAQKAKSDSDVVQLPAFGEGWNIGPTIGVNIPVNEQTVGSIGIGYTNRGTFHREGATPGVTTKLNPGDVTSVTGSVGYRGERLSLKGSVALSLESVTTLDGQEFYQAGGRISFTGAAGYAWDQNWSSRIQATWTHSEKNKVLLADATSIVVEAFNSNSDVTRIVVDTTYAKDGFSIGPTGGYVYRNRNGYNAETYQFLPAKTSWSAGLALAYAISDAIRLSLRGERIWVREGGSPDKYLIVGGAPFLVANSAVPVAITDAWSFTVAGTFRF